MGEDANRNAIDFEGLAALFEHTHRTTQMQAARSVDRALVVRNWLFGWYIVEFENGAGDRTDLYGKALIDRLSNRLKKNWKLKVYPQQTCGNSASSIWHIQRFNRHCLLNL